MKTKRALAIVVLLVLMTVTVLVPRRAEAKVDIVPVLIIGGAVLGAVVLVGVIVTAIKYNEPHFLLPPPAPDDRDPLNRQRVRFMSHCPPVNGSTTLVCW